jgi:hypothetical protein
MSTRREISQAVQRRLAAGESKADIYNALKEKYNPRAVEFSLAQWPEGAARKQHRPQNVPLIVIAVFFTLVKILQLSAIFQTLEPAQRTAFIPVAALPVIIYLFMIYGVANCNLIGYMLLILLSIQNLINLLHAGMSDPKMMMILAMSGAAVLLALLQKRRLFPNTSWLLRHKRDSSGTPVF